MLQYSLDDLFHKLAFIPIKKIVIEVNPLGLLLLTLDQPSGLNVYVFLHLK